MTQHSQGQVPANAAEAYEAFFVPALFGAWAPRVAEAARIEPGDAVLDVACGTGVLAREAQRRAGPEGMVVGLDRNPGMLAVARRKAPEITWLEGLAESLPLPDADFDVVASQFGLMFFDDRVAALREMMRVLRPDGRLAVAVWASLDRTPGYARMVELLDRLFGEEIAGELRAPYVLGAPETLAALSEDAGIPDAEIATVPGMAQFPSIEAWVLTDVKAWTLADRLDAEQVALLLREAERAFSAHVGPDGRVAFRSPALILTATKP